MLTARATQALLEMLRQGFHREGRDRRRSRWQITAVEVGLWSTERLEVRTLLTADPVFDPAIYSVVDLLETAALDTPVATAQATDPDGTGVTYSIAPRLPEHAGLLKINPQTGAITVDAALDYDNGDSAFYFDITATDGQAESGVAELYVALVDVDDEDPVQNPAHAIPYDVPEDAQPGQPGEPGYSVALVTASDPDTPDADLTYQILESGLPFSIDPSGELITVSGSLDYETRSTYQFTLRVSDPANNYSDLTMTVNVTDVNPVALDDTMYAGQGNPNGNAVTFYVLNNDTHTHGDALTITGASDPANGSVTFSATDVTYTPDPGFYSGQDTFTYPVLGSLTLQDDDHLQDGQDVPMPDTSEVAAALAEAFITPVFLYDDDEVPFDLNVDDLELQTTINAEWQTRGDNRVTYWTTYLLGAFQYEEGQDAQGDCAKLGNLRN